MKKNTTRWWIIAIASAAIVTGCADLGPLSGGAGVGGAGGADAGPSVDAAAQTPADDAGADASEVAGCIYSCTVDTVGQTHDCAAPVGTLVDDLDSGEIVLSIDVGAVGGGRVDLTATVCDPSNWLINFGDSPGNDGGGGDNGESSNDAEILIDDRRLRVYANDYEEGSRQLLSESDFVPSSECVTFTWTVRDGSFASDRGEIALTNDNLLKLDPAEDQEGTPDAVWYLGINRTIDSASRDGDGVDSAVICVR